MLRLDINRVNNPMERYCKGTVQKRALIFCRVEVLVANLFSLDHLRACIRHIWPASSSEGWTRARNIINCRGDKKAECFKFLKLTKKSRLFIYSGVFCLSIFWMNYLMIDNFTKFVLRCPLTRQGRSTSIATASPTTFSTPGRGSILPTRRNLYLQPSFFVLFLWFIAYQNSLKIC